MNHSRLLNNRFNIFHKRALRIVYNDFTFSFVELLEKNNLVTIHQRNLQILLIEMFEVKNNLVPEIMNGVFKLNDISYKTRIT